MSSKDALQPKSVIQNMKGSHKHKLKGFKKKSREKGARYAEEKEKLKARNKSFSAPMSMKENEKYSTMLRW